MYILNNPDEVINMPEDGFLDHDALLVTTPENVENLRINGNDVIIDGIVFHYNEAIFANDFIKFTRLEASSEEDLVQIYMPKGICRKATEQDLANSMSISEAYQEAVRFVKENGVRSLGGDMIVTYSNEPVFTADVIDEIYYEYNDDLEDEDFSALYDKYISDNK